MTEGPRTLADVVNGVKARLETERRKLGASLRNPLGLTIPDGCPGEVGAKIEACNAEAEKFERDRSEFDRAVTELPTLMSDASSTGLAIGKKADRLRQARYDLAQRHLALVEGRGALLRGIVEVLESQVRQAEADRAAAKSRVEKKLAAAGICEKTMQGAGYPAARVQLNHRIREAEEVRVGEAKVLQLLAALDYVRGCRGNLRADTLILGERLVAAFESLAGTLF